jgi:hypothetical protein
LGRKGERILFIIQSCSKKHCRLGIPQQQQQHPSPLPPPPPPTTNKKQPTITTTTTTKALCLPEM